MASNAENVSIWWRRHGRAVFITGLRPVGHYHGVEVQEHVMKHPRITGPLWEDTTGGWFVDFPITKGQ